MRHSTPSLQLQKWLIAFLTIVACNGSLALESQTAYSKEALLGNAIKAGLPDEVRTLIADGVDVNQPFEDGISPIHAAIINNQEEIVDLLLQANANPNVPDTTIGASPLHLAALYGRVNIINLLIKKGANVNAIMKFDISPLLVAAQFKQPEVIEVLIKNKANLQHTDQEGFSALHFAAQNGDDISAKILLENGANINARDKTHNATPLMIATEQKHTNVIHLLEESGT
jgi:cytohesin